MLKLYFESNPLFHDFLQLLVQFIVQTGQSSVRDTLFSDSSLHVQHLPEMQGVLAH